jgi:alkanesulfonate monooxygenase SsuD/methylene tetrahydromethanopterin reductase-like flavin-dependent oxidoreductase (luciferase family)
MTLPVMEPGLSADLLEQWSRAVDDGPFSSLCFGERIAFDNPETMTLLGAASTWTSRVRLVTTVVVPQLHDPVLLAKSLATADLLSGGRLTVGVGVGGREEDYLAVGAETSTQTMTGMADRVATMRRVWRGEQVVSGVRRIGPPPLQEGGPPVLVGTMGPRTVRHAADWADGLAGVTLDLDLAQVGALFDVAREAWTARGRTPHLATSFFVALDEESAARVQMHRHLRHYMSWLPSDLVDAMAPQTGHAGPAAGLAEVLRRLADLGTDEVHLIPTSADLSQVLRAEEAVAALG